MLKGIVVFCAILLGIIWVAAKVVPVAYSRAEEAATTAASEICGDEVEVDINSINLLSSGTVYYRYRCSDGVWHTASVKEE